MPKKINIKTIHEYPNNIKWGEGRMRSYKIITLDTHEPPHNINLIIQHQLPLTKQKFQKTHSFKYVNLLLLRMGGWGGRIQSTNEIYLKQKYGYLEKRLIRNRWDNSCIEPSLLQQGPGQHG